MNDRQTAQPHGDREAEEGLAGRPSQRAGSGRLSRGVQRGGGHRSERKEQWEGDGGGLEGHSHSERSRGRRGGRGGRGSMQQGGSGSDRKSKVNFCYFNTVLPV